METHSMTRSRRPPFFSAEDDESLLGAMLRVRDRHFPLYLPDEIVARLVLGQKATLWPTILTHLDREGFPRPRHLFGGMRYLPAVVAYFDRREGLMRPDQVSFAEDGPEMFRP
jgi:hypothetical protein